MYLKYGLPRRVFVRACAVASHVLVSWTAHLRSQHVPAAPNVFGSCRELCGSMCMCFGGVLDYCVLGDDRVSSLHTCVLCGANPVHANVVFGTVVVISVVLTVVRG